MKRKVGKIILRITLVPIFAVLFAIAGIPLWSILLGSVKEGVECYTDFVKGMWG